MKFFIAQFACETNTFAPGLTGWASFEQHGLYRGDGSLRAPAGTGAYLAFMRRLMEADGHEVTESVCAFAEPGGPVVGGVFEALRERILEDLRATLPVDAVQLLLHGAMVAQGYPDCEGELLGAVRQVVGSGVPVGVVLDLHCHLSAAMLAAADVCVAFKEYPHTDIDDCSREVYRLLCATATGRVRPVSAVCDCAMVGLWHTTREPMRSFVQRMKALEGRDGVLSVSLGHGFPWGDVPGAGARVWVVTDGDAPRAQTLAHRLAAEFWALRERTRAPVLELDEALDRIEALDGGPVVLADVADNPGAGAPGDSTFVLRALLRRPIGPAVVGAFWDLGTVQLCAEAGVGSTLTVRIGGKCGPHSGDPVDLAVTVRAVVEQHHQTLLGSRCSLGRSVWAEAAGGLHLVLASVRSQVGGTDAFTSLGLTLHDKRLIVVKSMQHFHTAFAPLAREVLYVRTPGAVDPDFAAIPYRQRSPDYWPRSAEPAGRPHVQPEDTPPLPP
jgi:microcystin degradation protein MlrC